MGLFSRKDKDPEKVATNALTMLGNRIAARANSVVRQIAFEADKAGMPMEFLQYVFYTLNEQQRRWPSLTKDQKKSLSWALRLVNETDAMPRYHAGLQVPPTEYEFTVDAAIQALAVWCNTTLFYEVLKDFKVALKKFARAYGKAAPECVKVAESCLQAHMELIARNSPRTVPNGELVFSFLFRI